MTTAEERTVPAGDPDEHHEVDPGAEPLADATPAGDPLAVDAGWGRWVWAVRALVVGAVLAGVVLRFVTRSPLWLDEALSVNIARLPLGDIPAALKMDGHPPLYYVLLHGWMDAFGEGSVAVRAFSGLWSLALFPLAWVAARRIGGTRVAVYTVALLALSPFAIRYGTETRMYAMLSVLALAGWLLVDDGLRRPTPGRLAAIAAITGLLLWTHYWAMWFLAAAGIGLLVHGWRARKDGRHDAYGATVRVIGALVVGGLTFLPWLPTLLYQGAHTGTPWARPVRPTEMVMFTLADFGGGPQAEATMLGWLLGIAVLLGVLGKATASRFDVDLDLRSRVEARPYAILVIGTMAIAEVVGYATGATYASRYAAVIFPFVIVLAGLGVDRLRSRPIVVGALAVLLLLGGIGGVRNVVTDRTDARRSVQAIQAAGQAGDVVVYCPDQLGPSGSRLLGEEFDQVTYPAFRRPERVDWVDYKEQLAKADPRAFATKLLARAEGHRIFFVYSLNYTTHRAICPKVLEALGEKRVPQTLTQPTDAFEQAGVVVLEPAAR
ncbi:glycosyltransferase family 39 protein [Aquihabitans sp. G128]|uniref:glycosyltransferase family 39 protein n=1 Tax=Aquihabitans sp. G128 TaxID=2849779 RepID=UPI001C2390B3|nr:glycosyltransferase family 39 protein [Aquihabitans sp. G128]QXC62096.1 glycosyltransferase family 39 protein [Aquihabitans sp. G128]